MIPDFDDVGNLPPGIHDATMAEVELRFANNPKRRGLFVSLVAWVEHMRVAGCLTVYINGSFVTEKVEPGDFDACWDATGVDLTKIDQILLGLTDGAQAACKAKFGGDIRID